MDHNLKRLEARAFALGFCEMTLQAIEIGALAETMGKHYYDGDADPDCRMVMDEIRDLCERLQKHCDRLGGWDPPRTLAEQAGWVGPVEQ